MRSRSECSTAERGQHRHAVVPAAPGRSSRAPGGPVEALHLQRLAGNRAATAVLRASPAPGPALGVVRRKAGIEYETGIPAQTGNVHSDEAGANWVPQDEVMFSGDGWEIQSDNSKLEFVTEPAVEIGDLPVVADRMLDAIDAAVPNLPARHAPWRPIEHVLGVGTHPYLIGPKPGSALTGAPQGTIGVPFERLPAFFRLLGSYDMAASQALMQEHRDQITRAQQRANGMPPGQKRTELESQITDRQARVGREEEAGPKAIRREALAQLSLSGTFAANILTQLVPKTTKQDPQVVASRGMAKLEGLLQLFGSYAKRATETTRTTYKKSNFPVMTRTSFASMYRAVPDLLKEYFAPAAENLLQLLNVDIDAYAFRPSASKFTIRDWIDSIVTPSTVYIPTNANPGINDYREMQSDHMTAPGATNLGVGRNNHNTDKSMGSMELDSNLVVVELRTLKHFANAGTFTTTAMRRLVGDLAALIDA